MAICWTICQFVFRLVAVIGLAVAIFAQVARHSAEPEGQVVVHLVDVGVEVSVDEEEARPVDNFMELPLVFDLHPGKHRLRLWRDGTMIDDQECQVEPGRDVVMALLDQEKFKRQSKPNGPATRLSPGRPRTSAERRAVEVGQ